MWNILKRKGNTSFNDNDERRERKSERLRDERIKIHGWGIPVYKDEKSLQRMTIRKSYQDVKTKVKRQTTE